MARHHAVRSRQGTLAFRNHEEARVLWDAVLAQVPDPLALCLMPDHLHLLHRDDVSAALGRALRGFARWRNARDGRAGSVWRRQSAPDDVAGVTKLRRSERYIHLNPCRAGLVTDPLAWAWSTHRDRVGLCVQAVRSPDPDPHRYHQYISADPTVDRNGTLLPVGSDRCDPAAIFGAVSELTRHPEGWIFRRGPARSLVVRCLRLTSSLTLGEIAAATGLSRRAVQRTPALWTPDARLVGRVAGDPRFPGLPAGDLRDLPRWGRYRHLR